MQQMQLHGGCRCSRRGVLALALLAAQAAAAPARAASVAQNAAQQSPPAKPAAQPPGVKPEAKRPAAQSSAMTEGDKDRVAKAWKQITEATTNGTLRKRAAALQVLASAGDRPEIMAILEQAMNDSHPELRKAAASAFGQMRARRAIPQLQKALDDPSPTVRVAAARALWQMHDYSGNDLLVRIVLRRAPAEESKMRKEMNKALGRVQDPSAVFLLALEEGMAFLPGPSGLAVPLYRELARDQAAPGRASAATLLSEHFTPAGIEALEQALVDPEPVVRAAAAVALGKTSRPDEIVQLSPLLHDSKPTVRLAAAVAIARLSPPGSGPTAAPAAHP